MEKNRFFTWVWRVNGVALLLLLLFVVLFGGYNIVREMLPRDRPAAITNVAPDPRGDEKWILGNPEEIDGTRFLYIPLESDKKDVSLPKPAMSSGLHAYGRGYFSPSRNLLFVDKETREMRWLFGGSRQLLISVEPLSLKKPYEKERVVDGIMYQIIDEDTDGDGKLTVEDRAGIAFSNPDGTGFRKVVKSAERVFGAKSLDGREVLLLYQAGGKGYAATVSLKDMSVRGTAEMPRVEQAP